MDIEHDRAVITNETPERVVATRGPAIAEPVVIATPVESEVRDVRTRNTISFPAIIAGILAILMLVVGGVIVARAGIDGSLDDPLVTVVGITGTALGGIVVFALGLGLLFAAFSGERGAILFLSVLIGVAAAVIAIEPNIADGKLGLERGFAVVLAIAAGAVALASALAPTMRLSSHRVERF